MLWIARDKDGALYLYNYKPTRLKEAFGLDIASSWQRIDDCSSIEIDRDKFPLVTWHNSPKKVELIIMEDKE